VSFEGRFYRIPEHRPETGTAGRPPTDVGRRLNLPRLNALDGSVSD
jgi:hypothetical protein